MNVAAPSTHAPALVLNADFRPLSYFPLSLWSWQDAVKAVFLDKVSIVEEYDEVVASPTFEMPLPSVIALKEYVVRDSSPAFTRFNLFLRDRFTCQYCNIGHNAKDLTFDHVIPRSQGGKTHWENIVAACGPCNRRKANKSLKSCGMSLARAPKRPDIWQLQENGRAFPPNFLHYTWNDYLYWDAQLENEWPSGHSQRNPITGQH